MKCDVAKDLMPSYLDGLTSQATDEEIREHLKGCVHCQEYLKEMQKTLEREKSDFLRPEAVEKRKKEIYPLRKWKRKIWLAVAATAAVLTLIFGGYLYFCQIGWKVDVSDINISYQEQGDTFLITFEDKNGRGLVSTGESNGQKFQFREVLKLPKGERRDSKLYYSLMFLEDGSVIRPDQKIGKLTKDDVLVLEFKDQTVELSLLDLVEQYAPDKLK